MALQPATFACADFSRPQGFWLYFSSGPLLLQRCHTACMQRATQCVTSFFARQGPSVFVYSRSMQANAGRLWTTCSHCVCLSAKFPTDHNTSGCTGSAEYGRAGRTATPQVFSRFTGRNRRAAFSSCPGQASLVRLNSRPCTNSALQTFSSSLLGDASALVGGKTAARTTLSQQNNVQRYRIMSVHLS